MTNKKARMHTAEHIMFAVLKKEYPKLVSTSLTLGTEKSRYCYKLPGDKISGESLVEIQEEINKIINKTIPITIKIVTRDKAKKVCTPDLFRLVPKSQKKIRLVQIDNFNTEACIGEHVSNTKKIKTFKFLQQKKIGKDTYRLDFTVVEIQDKKKMVKPSKFKLQLAKGVRDFPPEEKIIRDRIVNTLKQVFETCGYNPFETPIIERLDILTSKFGAGEGSDASKEIFKLKDQGNRNLGLRFELTLSLCRFIAMNPKLKLPFKRYEIGRVYRDGPIKLGRYREFYQCDVDVVGTNSMLADAEILLIVNEAFKKLDLEIEIEVSNRKLLNGILEQAGVGNDLRKPAMIIIDKLKKIGLKEVEKELSQKGLSKESVENLGKLLNITGDNKLNKLNDLIKNREGKQGLAELEELFNFLDQMNVKFTFNQTLARGLAYYTGPIYEVFLKESKVKFSVAGGGRYDQFVGNFLGGKKQIPATGIAFGLEPITEAIKLKTKQFPKSVSKIFVVPIKVTKEALEITQTLRKSGINTDIDLMGRGLSKNLDYADKQKIPYVIIVGKKDLENKQVTVRNMASGKEEKIQVNKIVDFDFTL